jgi:L-ascorbate metabolism protein UlaG (beta-lactamase superfamily)
MRRTALLAALAAAGCLRGVKPDVSGVVDVAPPGSDVVRLTYLGVGGWIMARGDVQLLAAPLFTNPSLFRTGLMPIRSDTALVSRHMAAYDVSEARAILVGHAHYDHLMDVPQVARRHAPGARILGSRTVLNTLGTWSGLADRVDVVEGFAGGQHDPGRWMALESGLRVLPLRSLHAPHFEGATLYQGTASEPFLDEPRWASEWLDGETHAFLVDFLDPDGSVAFRIYYQDAVVQAPLGLAPESVIRERPVDVAVLVPATFDQVEWHPEAFVENLRPRWVLLGHWEDFFRSPSQPTRSILLTDIQHFRNRLERVFSGPSWLPEVGTEFRFPIGE